jgi:hypothetical protein
LNRAQILFFTAVIVFVGLSCNNENQVASDNTDTVLTQSANDSFLLYVESTPHLPRKAGIGHPFDSLVFDRVIAYEFDGRERENSRIIKEDGQFVKTIKRQKYLTPEQVRMITACFSDTLSYGEGTRPCFAPSEALVFFNGTKPVMSIDICLDCNYLESSVPIPARNAKQLKVDGRVIPAIGFSVQGRQCIIDLSRELNFVYGNFK